MDFDRYFHYEINRCDSNTIMNIKNLIRNIWSCRAGKVITVILLALVALQIILSIAVTPIARSAISSALVPEARLKSLYISLLGGTVTLRGLEIAQPEGFGDGNVLSLGQARVNISLTALLAGKIKVSSVRIADLSVVVMSDTNGVMNVTRLTPPSGEADVAEEAPADESAEPSSLAVKVGTIRLERLSFTYLDHRKNEQKPIEINLRKADLAVQDLLFAPAQGDRRELLTDIRFTGQFEHADTPPSFIGLAARLGPVGTGIPGVVANLIISGIELGAMGQVIPPGVAATLGGDMIDIDAKVRVASDILDVNAVLETTGAKFPVTVGGTPDKPEIGAGAIFFGAFGRVGNLVGNTASDVASAGLAVGEGAVNVATSVGKGAAGIVTGVGKGLFSTVKSAATLDVKGVGEGLSGTVTSAGKGAIDTVKEAGGAAASTVSEASSATMGGNRAGDWRASKKARFDAGWQAAQSWVKEQSYPAPGGTKE